MLVLLYKDGASSTLVALTPEDTAFITSDSMKYTITSVTVTLMVGTVVDLYFTLVVRTFYLTKLYYPDI
jgi:hypothetical protein